MDQKWRAASVTRPNLTVRAVLSFCPTNLTIFEADLLSGGFTTVTYNRRNAECRNAQSEPIPTSPSQQSSPRENTPSGKSQTNKQRAPTKPRYDWSSVCVGTIVWAHNLMGSRKGRPAYVWRKEDDQRTVVVIPISSGERANYLPRITSGEETSEDNDEDLRLKDGKRMIKRSWLICNMAVRVPASTLKPYFDGSYVPEENWMTLVDSLCLRIETYRRSKSTASDTSTSTDMSADN